MTGATKQATKDGEGGAAAASTRRPRADAVRNRQSIIDAATEVFRELGLDASVAVIAKRAGVGSGTLFRNFPTKDDLIRAVVVTRMDAWIEDAQRIVALPDAIEAFEQFMYLAAGAQARDRGLAEAIQQHVLDDPTMLDCKRGAYELAELVLGRAQKAGVVRKDVTVDDLHFLIHATASGDPIVRVNSEALHRRHLRIVLDGLHPEGASKLDS